MPGRQNFYPRPPRGGRLLSKTEILAQLAISIHALREEGDGRGRHLRSCQLISIHALREEGNGSSVTVSYSGEDFYPRPPRGGRLTSCNHLVETIKISIHALREEGDPWHRRTCWPKHISIHALREEGDASCRCSRLVNERFLSTPSARRATWVW